MPKEKLNLDIDQIRVHEALFLDCRIANNAQPAIGPEQVAGFTDPNVVVLPFFSIEKRLVSFEVRVHTQALGEDGAELPLTGDFRLHLSFQVANLSELLRPNTLSPAPVPVPELSMMLVGAAYSTARGMVMSKVSDTVLGGFALPLRSVKRLMEDSNVLLRERQSEATAPVAPKRARKSRPAPPSII